MLTDILKMFKHSVTLVALLCRFVFFSAVFSPSDSRRVLYLVECVYLFVFQQDYRKTLTAVVRIFRNI